MSDAETGDRPPQVEPHRLPGLYVVRAASADMLATKSLVAGQSVYGEKRVQCKDTATDAAVEYRAWNPYRSKLAAAVITGLQTTYVQPKARVLYLGAASGTTVSHVSDLVGPEGVVYAVEFSHRSGAELTALAESRPNIVPIIHDARRVAEYAALIGDKVDCVIVDVAQPDQSRILALNCQHFVKEGGGFLIVMDAGCIDSTADAAAVFASEVKKMRDMGLKPKEQITLEPFERDHAVVIGTFSPS